jgi:hypothetical protein
MRLADMQRAIAHTLQTGVPPDDAAVALVGGQSPDRRLQIHARHYAASLARAIVERFPATVWLIGSDSVLEAARAFVRAHPPTRPCIAEYGEQFPPFLAAGVPALQYLEQFATIDWHLGRLALATDVAVVHLDVEWSVDELIGFYLSGEAPDRYEIRRERVHLELRGTRGELWIQRV